MEEFEKLLEVSDILNGPDGCPWDATQTFESLRRYVIEEAHEVVEAVDTKNDEELVEELGDLFYTVIFYAKVAEKEGKFALKDVIKKVTEKLVRRHPHVFGDVKTKDISVIEKNWNAIKKEEKKGRKTPFDGIPPSLPQVMRAQKIAKRLKKEGHPPLSSYETESEKLSEFLKMIEETEEDLEMLLSAHLNIAQKAFDLQE